MADEDIKADIVSALIVDAEPVTEAPQEDEIQAADETVLEDVTTDETEDETEDDLIVEDDDTEDEDPDEDDGSTEVDTYIIKRDGEEVTATIDELIAEFSIGSTARKRLEEATAIRAQAEETGRAEGMQQAEVQIATRTAEVDSAREQLSQLFGIVGNEIFSPRVARPDQNMQETDPLGYVSAMENWREDQARINGVQQQIASMTQEQNRLMEQRKAEIKREQQLSLSRKRPELAEPEKAKAFTADVRLAQEHFGFTGEEVNAFPDHRGLLVLEFVGQTLAKLNATGPTPAQKIVQKAKVKTMKPGAVAHKRSAVQKQTRANRDRARQSGDHRDVAATLIVDAPR